MPVSRVFRVLERGDRYLSSFLLGFNENLTSLLGPYPHSKSGAHSCVIKRLQLRQETRPEFAVEAGFVRWQTSKIITTVLQFMFILGATLTVHNPLGFFVHELLRN